MDWKPYNGSKYLNYSEILTWCQATAEDHPDWVELTILGNSLHDRPIVLMTIGDVHGDRSDRPAMWLDGGTHAAEWTGVMAALHTVSRWVEALSRGDAATLERFRSTTAYVVPCISPDGLQALMDGAAFLRSTLRGPPRGTHRVGLDPRDLTGNGRVGWMRWRHPSGSWIADPDQPMFMRLRTLDDDPAHAWCFSSEGIFIHWDGTQWMDAPREYGLDLNRNFPVAWAPFRMFGMDGGAFPLSAPESRAIVEAVHARPNIAVALTNHTYTGCILTQPYRDPSPLSKADIDLMERLAEQSVEGTDYRVIRVHPDFVYDPEKPVVGVWADALCCTFGIPGYTLELWNPYAFAGVEVEDPVQFFQKPDEDIIRALVEKFTTLPGGVMPWTPFEHPQLGEVEIGGIDYYRTIRNPPETELPAECDQGFQVAERLLRATPMIRVNITTESLGDGLTRLTARVENRGFLPTSGLGHGETIERVPPVKIHLAAKDGLEIIEGDATQVLGHLDGWGTRQVGFGRHGLYPGLGGRGTRAQGQWMVRGTGSASIDWTAPRAGSGSATVSVGGS